MKVSGRHGRLRLRLEPDEAQLLSSLFDQLEAVDELGPDDDVRKRLYPAAYPDDDAAEAEYRTLTEAALQTERHERIAACRADLTHASDVELGDEEAGRRWIQVLNDLRLSLGTRLGITEDDEQGLDPSAPDAQPRFVYYWLTAVQDSVVRGLMR